MALEFDWLVLSGFGATPQIDGKQEGIVTVSLDTGDNRFYSEVEVSVLVERRADITWGEIEEQSRAAAIESLRTALEALESGTIEELRERMTERRAANDAADDARWKEELDEKFSKIGAPGTAD